MAASSAAFFVEATTENELKGAKGDKGVKGEDGVRGDKGEIGTKSDGSFFVVQITDPSKPNR